MDFHLPQFCQSSLGNKQEFQLPHTLLSFYNVSGFVKQNKTSATQVKHASHPHRLSMPEKTRGSGHCTGHRPSKTGTRKQQSVWKLAVNYTASPSPNLHHHCLQCTLSCKTFLTYSRDSQQRPPTSTMLTKSFSPRVSRIDLTAFFISCRACPWVLPLLSTTCQAYCEHYVMHIVQQLPITTCHAQSDTVR